jgi:MoaA/NifB/PqqE/SkfB family radical SAM enzyme
VNWKKKVRVFRNNWRALSYYWRKRIILPGLPSYIWIEPTNHCNLNCIMCPSGAGKVHVKRGFMKLELFKKIIDEIHPHTSTAVLALSGESMLHPDLFEMIHYAEGNQVKVLLNTNATLLNREKAVLLLESGISYISFAFDGTTKSQYEKVRKGADFEETLENILVFLRLKKEKNLKKPYTVLSILNLNIEDPQDSEKKEFFNKFDTLIDDIHIREVNSWGNVFKETQDFTFEKFSGKGTPCGRLWNTISIAWNGDVVPCTYNMNHDYLLGNIQDMPMEKIWNSSKLIQLRQDTQNIRCSHRASHHSRRFSREFFWIWIPEKGHKISIPIEKR